MEMEKQAVTASNEVATTKKPKQGVVAKKKKPVVNTIEYKGNKEIEQDMQKKASLQIANSNAAKPEQHPLNWDMVNDVLIRLHNDVMYLDKKLVVKGQNKKNPEIVDTVEEEEKVKSYIKFGTVISTGSNRQVHVGDVIAANLQGVKGVDYAPGYATVANYAIISKLKDGNKPEPVSKNILGRILQGISKWLGRGNVHK